MSLSKETIVDKIEILTNGVVQVRFATNILENGEVISKSYLRDSISPGRDFSDQPESVKAICKTVHTQQVIDAYVESLRIENERLGK